MFVLDKVKHIQNPGNTSAPLVLKMFDQYEAYKWSVYGNQSVVADVLCSLLLRLFPFKVTKSDVTNLVESVMLNESSNFVKSLLLTSCCTAPTELRAFE